ncbi:C40 family peptidase [Trinickia fusca]|uniref:Peptidoglycan endopeptidase n=1 Tax=Trinickia fusca TaxID=2419777 RepID=A0A494XNZ3_9BURK|nr:C40 family peptidase [Trinickia fusca]RKP52385.1 peptidoglycan endopeptidase [Trinickia fusca]
MRRFGFVLLTLLTLAACSSAPPRYSRSSSVSPSASAGNALRTMPPGSPNFVDHSIGREEISIQAMSLVGVPYRWGGNTPESGFDCSGFVRYVVARSADVNLPRTTADMSERGKAIEPDEIAPGDLIFFNTTGRAHSHVGIYVGKLRFVNAPSTGGTVRLDYLTNSYWAKRFDGIRRVAPPLDRPAPFDTPTYLAAPKQTPVPVATAAEPVTPVLARPATPATPATPAMPAMPVVPTVPTPALALATRSAIPTNAAPDAIDASADAFEPPPSAAALAERQARQAGAQSVSPTTQAPADGMQIMRASTGLVATPAPTTTSDDPIARFANSSE